MSQLTVTDTPIQIAARGSGTLVVQNLDDSVPVYLDYSSAVTASGTTGGLRLGPGLSSEFKIRTNANLNYPPAPSAIGPWVVCGAGQTATVAYLVFQD